MARIIILKQTLLLSLIILFIVSCNSQPKNITTNRDSMNWKTIKIQSETGANSFDYEFNQYFLLDNFTGFIIGDNSIVEVYNSVIENERPINHSNIDALLFKTEDGGLTFKRVVLGKGSLEQIVNDNQNNLYAIKSIYKPYPTRDYSILKSSDLGETWQEMSSFNNYKIKTIQFYNDLIGVACVKKISKKHEDAQLFKTIDGGKNWTELIVNTRDIDLYNVQFKNKNELFTFRETTDLRQSATINFTTGDCQVYDPSLEKGYYFSGMFHDDSTGDLYSRITKYGVIHELKLFNHNTQKIVTYNLKNNTKEYIKGISISGNYIGVLREDNDKTQYYYSIDYGENWIQENLPDDFVDAHPTALYGKGLVWVKSSLDLYNFQVRTINNK